MDDLVTDIRLENGLRVVMKQDFFSNIVALQCWVRTGSLNEEPHERGMAHLLEHMLFKGTKKRKVGEISKIVESCGGDINAYTTFDCTVFYLTLAAEHAPLGVDILADALLNSVIDPYELEREKQVIFEEIRGSEDNPGAKLGRKVFERVFSGMGAERPIIGSIDSVKSFSRQSVLNFLSKWYVPNNMIFLCVGNFEVDNMVSVIDSCFGKVPYTPMIPPAIGAVNKINRTEVQLIKGDFQQQRIEVAFQGPSLDHYDAIYLDLAAFILGVGDSSRLNLEIRNRLGFAASVSSSYYYPSFGGVFEISAIAHQGKLLECVESLAREFTKLFDDENITDEDIQRALNNLRSDRYYQEETVAGKAQAIGFGLYSQHGVFYDDFYELVASRANRAKLQNALKKWLNPEKAVIVVLLPEDHDVTEEQVLSAYRKGVNHSKSKYVAPVKVNTVETLLEPKVIDLKPGLRFIYRQKPESKLFCLVGSTQGGLRAETEDDVGLHHAVASLLGTATGHLNHRKFLTAVEGRGATIGGFSGKDSIGLKLICLSEQTEELLHLWTDVLLNPAFPEEQWVANQREILDGIRTENDNPANIAIKLFQKGVFGSHPYRFPTYGCKESVQSFNTEKLLESWTAIRQRRPWVISAVGPFEPEYVVDLLNKRLEGFTPSTDSSISWQAPSSLVENASLTSQKVREQSHILVGSLGLTWGSDDRPALDVVGSILGGAGGRLFTRLRDRDGLAYSVAPIISYGCFPGIFGAYIACSPDKASQAKASLKRELFEMAESLVPGEEIDRAIKYIVGGHEADMQRGHAQAMTMSLMEAYGYGYDDFISYPEKVRRVGAAEVQKVCQKLLLSQPLVDVVVGQQDT